MPMLNVSKEKGRTPWEIFPGVDSIHGSNDASLFSSSVPVLLHEKLKLSEVDHGHQSIDGASASLKEIHPDVEVEELLDDGENRAIGSLLPDDEDELLAGIIDGFGPSQFPNHVDDLEEYDLFGSGGGLELESDAHENLNFGISRVSLADPVVSNGAAHVGFSNGGATVTGEHPLGEHPSRTLFVRNINSNVEDSELRSLFEQYGDIRTLYTACKHRGFVMISYFDIRAARTALRALQNKPLRRRKLDIHFSIPKDNPSDKDMNQGTLVVFNLDPSVSNDDLRQIFGAYGEIKEIRETPHKRHHKFIEYYDVRAAEAALRSLNRSDIAGKRIKLEPSRPGGARRNSTVQSNQEPEQDDSWTFRHPLGSSIGNSSPGNWPQFGSPIEHSSMRSPGTSPGFRSLSPTMGNNLLGLASILHPHASNSLRVAPIGEDHRMGGHADLPNGSNHGVPFHQSHSFPEPKISQFGGTVSSLGASNSNGSAVETLSGPQFLWGSPKLQPQQSNSSSWKAQSLVNAFTSGGQGDMFSLSNHQKSFLNSSQHHHHHLHHVGSAPSALPFDKHFGFYPDSPVLSPGFRGMGIGPRDGSLMVNYGARTTLNSGVAVPGNMSNNGSPGFGMMSSQRLSPLFLGNGHFPGHAASSFEGLTERSRTRRVDNNGNQMDNKKQFQLDLDKIRSGEDTRTTLMIKNIPNKYTSKMLLAAIDEQHKGTYDFLYLPIDFKNKCNVGYAFINMVSPSLIIPFYEALNGKKWEKFNSEKVAALAYARIQGKTALVAHFQNSSLMNEDKRCRPILFHSESSELGDQIVQEHLSSGCLHIHQVCRSNESDFLESQGSPPEEDPVDKLENS
ncbi:protein MEI2-like 5 isoform X2 [Nicotiana sylvestris]|uniref:Protein MEI2-like 5 isoform X2 n=2 Tax=Nicotiana TaxID=4085 RepID=A0A1S4BMG9_TOBAC|nr:PREDICTED: protein MEI2-like 5 [Nicotiana sylvestris]XP_009766584.1 PREDICTED: protein MEI2-like 5 [Nicotiana sylvestris]XP_016490054.1 PREDICTED: protein MEI2-like 5 isoform X2 [Nicotiana tabacum]